MRYLLVTIVIMCVVAGAAQKTTRSKLKPNGEAFAVERADTVAVDSAQVRFSGYEKALRATVESFFITNNTADSLSNIAITIRYLDMQGRELHQRTETIKMELPAGATRMARISSWDRQKVWYYYLTEPTRTRGQATPYRVSIKPLYTIK